MKTVKDLREALERIPDSTPIITVDTRSGVVEEASFSFTEFNEGDDEYGVELPIGTPVFAIYLG